MKKINSNKKEFLQLVLPTILLTFGFIVVLLFLFTNAAEKVEQKQMAVQKEYFLQYGFHVEEIITYSGDSKEEQNISIVNPQKRKFLIGTKNKLGSEKLMIVEAEDTVIQYGRRYNSETKILVKFVEDDGTIKELYKFPGIIRSHQRFY